MAVQMSKEPFELGDFLVANVVARMVIQEVDAAQPRGKR